MASKGQTHQKRAREIARRERRELKQAKKEARAAGEVPAEDEAGDASAADEGGEAPAADEAGEAPADGDPETAQGSIQ